MTRVVGLMAFMICISGCGVCLHQPLHSDDTLFFTPELLGKWRTGNPDATWEFIQGEGKSYTLRSNLSDAAKTVYLARLGNTLFMTAAGFPHAEKPDQPACRYILSGKIVLHDEGFTLHPVDVESLAAILKDTRNAPPHQHSESPSVSFIVFTGESQPIQRFFSEHANDTGLFDGSSIKTFTRVSDRRNRD